MKGAMRMLKTKIDKIRKKMLLFGYDMAVIGRRDNFTWLCGEDAGICLNGEGLPILLIVTRDGGYLVGAEMDTKRVYTESLGSPTDIETVVVKWYEESPSQRAAGIIKNAVADIPFADCKQDTKFFADLHYPLEEHEMERYREVALLAEQSIAEVAQLIEPGMTENHVRTLLAKSYADKKLDGIVYIIGADSRIADYRHCIATDRKIEKLVMLAPACQKYGLTAPITRMICFGDIPSETAEKYEIACLIEAATVDMAREGVKYNDIFNMQCSLYEKYGYPDEWKKHFQGGRTGYLVNDASLTLDPEATISDNQAFNWYITLTGTKVEETMLTSKKHGQLILSQNSLWVTKEYSVGGNIYKLPQIMTR